MGGETEMNSVIVFFLSPDNDKIKDPIKYYVENCETEIFEGKQSTDASIQYLLQKAADNGEPITKIISIITNEVECNKKTGVRTWDNFQERVKTWISEEKLSKVYENINIEFLPIKYNENLADTTSSAADIYRQLSAYIFNIDEKISVYMDYTGGFRDISFLMATIVRYLEYHELPCKEIVYAHWEKESSKKNQLHRINNIYEMFQLLNGVDQFTRTGNADLLLQCYRKTDNESIKKVLEKIVEFSHAMSLCDIRKIDTILFDLNNSLAAYAKEASTEGLFECVFGDMVKIIREKMKIKEGEELSYLQVISWCVDNNMLQQALTLYTEKMPEYYIKNRILEDDINILTKKYDMTDKKIEQFESLLREVFERGEVLKNVNIEEIKDEEIKRAFFQLKAFETENYSEEGEKIPENSIKLYEEKVVIDAKNTKKLIKEISDKNNWPMCHYFLYMDEEDYQYRKRKKTPIKSFYWLKEKEDEGVNDAIIKALMYYFALKLARNQVSHASVGESVDDDRYAIHLYQKKYGIKMDGYDEIKQLLREGIEASRKAATYVNSNREK